MSNSSPDEQLPSHVRRAQLQQRLSDLKGNAKQLRRELRRIPGRHDTLFKVLCVCTVGAIVGAALVSAQVRLSLRQAMHHLRTNLGTDPVQLREDAIREIEASLNIGWDAREVQLKRIVSETFDESDESLKQFLRAAGLAPAEFAREPTEEIVVGREVAPSGVVGMSGKIFAPNDLGNEAVPLFTLRPNTRALWVPDPTPLRSKQLLGIPLLPDIEPVRLAAEEDLIPGLKTSLQKNWRHRTNSWGLRGPEPDLVADVRVLALGDSFIHGYCLDEADTPPRKLQNQLAATMGRTVSVLNCGITAAGPKHYWHLFDKFVDRFKPHLVLVSPFANDFGNARGVWKGEGDDWQRAGFYLSRIRFACDKRQTVFLVCPVADSHVLYDRGQSYSDRIARLFVRLSSERFLGTIDAFATESLRLRGQGSADSLFHQVDGIHYSVLGAELWAHEVARRVALLLDHLPGAN